MHFDFASFLLGAGFALIGEFALICLARHLFRSRVYRLYRVLRHPR